ncbi:hypothetical protein T09_3240 [Trichinella sp. T9]|nr:hypothetical protein T09_12703 [Trichinella sp. T9]KRX51291.1 hypothetical protein T09_3240 [Trichinella sp. T9]
MTNGSMSSHWCGFPSTMMDSMLRSVQINLFACPFPCECDLDRDVLLGLGHNTGFHVDERECGPPLGEIIRQDQDVLIPRRGPFQRCQDVHADLLQEVSLSYGMHWRTVVIRQAFPPRTLHACAAPCVHVAAHSGPEESAFHSCQCLTLAQVTCELTIVHGLHDIISEGSRHQHLLRPFISRQSAAISHSVPFSNIRCNGAAMFAKPLMNLR